MDRRSLDFLEFPQLLEHLKSLATSELGRRAAGELRPCSDPLYVRASLEETAQMKAYVEEFGVPEGGFKDIGSLLDRVCRGAPLGPQELRDVAASIRASEALKEAFRGLEDRFWRLRELAKGIHAPRGLAEEIERAISPRGEILDDASPELAEIRRKLRRQRDKIQRRLEALVSEGLRRGILQSDLITQRNERFVLLVRADAKGRMKGIVHDTSSSGASLYIEPMEVVELNNELGMLRQREREEEERVLRYLSLRVSEKAVELREDLQLQGKIDLLYAKARLAIDLRAYPPALSEEGGVRLIQARHPLLELGGEEVVPVDLFLGPRERILIISGANAGGKTVALKTLGLLVLMAQSGMLIPASADSTLPIFSKVFAHIGDEQSLKEHLSTFSSFVIWLKDVIPQVDPFTLVLIDEIGTGTDYVQGAALAMAVLDEIRSRGGYAVVTTHLDPLKAYGYREEGVTNAAVEFDPETMAPTFRLLYGQAGRSWTFPIAERWGMPEGVICRAKAYQAEIEDPQQGVLEELGEIKARFERELEEARALKEEARRRERRLREILEGIKAKRREILRRIEERGRRRLSELEERLRKLIREASLHPERAAAIKGEVRRIKEAFSTSPLLPRTSGRSLTEVREGDWVRVRGLGRSGEVLRVGTDGRVEVLVGSIKVKVSRGELEAASREEATRDEGRVVLEAEGMGSRELNVVGLRVQEALSKVDKLIDEALIHGWDEVQIVHGIGTGRLRKAIRDHLKEIPWIKGLKSAPLDKGGGGVTIVELK